MDTTSFESSLFGDDEPAERAQVLAPAPVKEWQVELLRKALDSRGLQSMDDRQRLVEGHVGRPIASLRAMTQDEAMSLLTKLGSNAPTGDSSSSSSSSYSWDNREGETWIDRL